MSTMCAWMRAGRRCRRRARPPPPPPRRTAAGTGSWRCSSAATARRPSWASRPARPTCPGCRRAASRASPACARAACPCAGSRAGRRAARRAGSAAARRRAPAAAGSTTPSRRAWSCPRGCGCPSYCWANRATRPSPDGSEEERAEARGEATADDIGRPWLMREPKQNMTSISFIQSPYSGTRLETHVFLLHGSERAAL